MSRVGPDGSGSMLADHTGCWGIHLDAPRRPLARHASSEFRQGRCAYRVSKTLLARKLIPSTRPPYVYTLAARTQNRVMASSIQDTLPPGGHQLIPHAGDGSPDWPPSCVRSEWSARPDTSSHHVCGAATMYLSVFRIHTEMYGVFCVARLRNVPVDVSTQ